MKSQFLFTLPLAATLMVPAFAQQNTNYSNNNAGQQPAATTAAPTTQATGATSDDQNLSAHQPLQPERHEGFWGHLNPFARKKYVNRQLQPIRDRMNELDELTSSNSKMIRDVDSRSTEGIRLATAKATEADQHAVDAGNRAQQAQQLAQQTTARLQTVQQAVSNVDQYQAVSDTEIRFRPGQTALSARAKQALDQLAEPLKSQRGYIVEVQGFSSGKGPSAIQNSQNMAEAVVRYLVINHDIPVYRIYTVGMGNAAVQNTANGSTPRRIRGGRVEISLLHNGIGELSQTAQANAPAAGQQPGTQQQAAPATSYNQGGVSGTAASSAPAQQQQPALSTGAAGNTSNAPASTTPQTPR